MKIIPHNWKEKLVYAASMLLSAIINGGKRKFKYNFKNILVFKWDEIGDLCYSLHVFDLLKEQYPQATITLVCKPYCYSLVKDHQSIDVVLTTQKVDGKNYDLIVDLRGSWESIIYAIQYKPKVRLDRATVRFANKKTGQHPHEVFTNLQVIAPLLSIVPVEPKPRMGISEAVQLYAQQYIQLNSLNRFAVFHCGARRELRRWLPANFAAIAKWLIEEHNMQIIFTGAIEDEEVVKNIQAQIGYPSLSTCGTFDLISFAALVQQASIYIGNESGPLCIAAVTGAKSLGLFGPGEPHVFYPYGKHSDYIHHILACNPCDQIHCVHPENPCIQRITVEEVKVKINKLLSSNESY